MLHYCIYAILISLLLREIEGAKENFLPERRFSDQKEEIEWNSNSKKRAGGRKERLKRRGDWKEEGKSRIGEKNTAGNIKSPNIN